MFSLGFKTIFENNYENQNLELTYLENIPWYFRIYLHTLKLNYENSNEIVKPSKLLHAHAVFFWFLIIDLIFIILKK